MERKPLLSVIVPVYNTGKHLERCMNSLLKQSYKNLEIILIDDGSTDDSPAMCDAFREAVNNVKVLHKKNAGLGYARNSGLDIAGGDYVAFVDSDDYVDENMYLRLMEKCICEDARAVFCDYTIVRNDGTSIPMKSEMDEGIYSGNQVLRAILGADPQARMDFDFDMSVCKGIYSRDLLETESIRFQSERNVICEDLVFNIQFLQKAERVSYIKDGLYYYCENEGSLTHRYILNRLEKEKHLYGIIKEQVDMPHADWIRYHRLFLGRVRSTIAQEVYYEKSSSKKERIRAIRKIAEDEMVRTVIETYPIRDNPIKLRIFNTFLKWNFCMGMYLLIILKR